MTARRQSSNVSYQSSTTRCQCGISVRRKSAIACGGQTPGSGFSSATRLSVMAKYDVPNVATWPSHHAWRAIHSMAS
jgi:hypothetical protein